VARRQLLDQGRQDARRIFCDRARIPERAQRASEKDGIIPEAMEEIH
jgi:hypothetical protein